MSNPQADALVFQKFHGNLRDAPKHHMGAGHLRDGIVAVLREPGVKEFPSTL